MPCVERVLVKLHAALAGFRLVMFDQRGTGAGTLRCPVLQAADGAWDLLAAPPGAVETCARSIGPARRFFTTPETLAGIDRLRQALGVSRLSLDGVSYATFVAERYALRYPTHVERLVLDSVVPQQGVDPLYRDVFPGTARVLRSVCVELSCGLDPAAELATVVRPRQDGPALLGRAGRRERHISPLSVLGSGRTLGSGRASVSARCGAAYAGRPRRPRRAGAFSRDPAAAGPGSPAGRRARPLDAAGPGRAGTGAGSPRPPRGGPGAGHSVHLRARNPAVRKLLTRFIDSPS